MKEAAELLLLDTLPERQHTHPVLVQPPRERFVLGRLLVDGVVLPDQVGFPNEQGDLIQHRPDRWKGAPELELGPLVHGIVRQVHLEGPERLHN
jgi:hypothetical protein